MNHLAFRERPLQPEKAPKGWYRCAMVVARKHRWTGTMSLAIRRRDFLPLALAAASSPTSVMAQSVELPIVATLIGAPNPPDATSMAWLGAVRNGLAEHGWVDGRNVVVVARFTAGQAELTALFSRELIAMRPALFVTGTTENAVAVHGQAPEIPLVFVAVPDPVVAGLVASYRQPGGNATGITHLEPSVAGKMVDLLLAVAPQTSVVFFFTNPASALSPVLWHPYAVAAANAHGVRFEEAYVSTLGEVEPAVAAMAATPGAGIIIPSNNWVHNNAAAFVEPINRFRLPAIYPAHRMVEQGGLMGIGVDTVELFRMGGDYAGRILHGTNPGDLPVRTATFSTVINMQTAAALGIDIPPIVLITANRIIDE